MALDRLEALVRNRLKRPQPRTHTLDGFTAGTGLTLEPTTSRPHLETPNKVANPTPAQTSSTKHSRTVLPLLLMA